VATWLLFFHLLGAFLFVAGAVVAGVLQLGAMRRSRPSEIALLLGLTRWGVLFVALGALMTLGFGIGLANELDLSLGESWISASLALWVAAMGLGALGGRTARHARYLARRLSGEDDRPSQELRDLVAHRPALLASYASGACLLAIVVLMVWRP
jgi:uncharacterized membrane protein